MFSYPGSCKNCFNVVGGDGVKSGRGNGGDGDGDGNDDGESGDGGDGV